VWEDGRDGSPENYEIYYKRHPMGNTVGIEPSNSELPMEFKLGQNYPNPFNPVTVIKLDIPSNAIRETSNVKMIIYDILGREILTLVDEELRPGSYQFEWDAANYPSGVYYYKLSVGQYWLTRKAVLIE
jgi:flagellar hook assembly protein FlgD